MPSRRKHSQSDQPATTTISGAHSDEETVLTQGWVTDRARLSLVDPRTPTFAATQPEPSRQERAARSLLARGASMRADADR
jgi:hypothetical protein